MFDMALPDLNLLIYLHLLIKYGNATKVAQAMGVSQPGVSAALKRLRAVLNDPVFVRTGGRMVPTPKAQAVHAQTAGTLEMWERLAEGELVFDPARTNRGYTLLASDYILHQMLAPLAGELARRAPGATLRVIPPNPYRRLQTVVKREADFAIGYYHEAPEELRVRRLFVESVVCVMRQSHPAARSFDLDAFVRYPHVGIASVAQGSYSATLERSLLERGIHRRLPLTVPSYLAVPSLLVETDYIALLPASLATSFAKQMPLQVHASPLELPALDVSILYHNNAQDDVSHQWFRQLTVEVVGMAGLRGMSERQV
ncbi:LysR family transcriptional regulator [Ottowia caeni]|uniref:LysR family transcriptional regulator n=1 Tax=Ottowia caeni TaxID=2870339 RepID=UPI003D70F99D